MTDSDRCVVCLSGAINGGVSHVCVKVRGHLARGMRSLPAAVLEAAAAAAVSSITAIDR